MICCRRAISLMKAGHLNLGCHAQTDISSLREKAECKCAFTLIKSGRQSSDMIVIFNKVQGRV